MSHNTTSFRRFASYNHIILFLFIKREAIGNRLYAVNFVVDIWKLRDLRGKEKIH